MFYWLKASCFTVKAWIPLKLVLCSPRRLCVLPNVPVGSHLWGQLPITKLVDVVGFEPTTFRLRAEYSDPVELHIHKNLYLILRTNYNHLTTLYPPVNNLLKKWWLRSDLNWQHEVLQTSALHWSYWAIKVIDKSKESNLFGTASLHLYHALRTSTCQNHDVWLDSNQRLLLQPLTYN